MVDDFRELTDVYIVFIAEWERAENGNKAAGKRARLKTLEMEKLLKRLRQRSLVDHR